MLSAEKCCLQGVNIYINKGKKTSKDKFFSINIFAHHHLDLTSNMQLT